MAKQQDRRGRLRKWAGYPLSFFLGVLLAFGAYHFLAREKPSSPEGFFQKVFVADKIINSQLYEIGIVKKNVFLEHSTSKREGGMAWTESLLKVQIPRSTSFSLVEEHFRRSLSSAGDAFSLDASKSGKSLHLEVKVMGRVTHRLTFIYPASRARVAIVIDDLGKESPIAREILNWDIPLTLSILPFTAHAKNIASEAHRKGKEVILHLPMEPRGYPKIRPGEGVLLEEMNEEELLRQLSKDIEAIPYIKGVSNHMGSRLMEDPEKIRVILAELRRRKFFFLDSRTTPQTIGLQTAKSLGLRVAERSLFLDHSARKEDVKKQLEQLIQLSLSKGKAIGIGHPHPSTIKSLKEMIPKMQEKGIEIVLLSDLME